MFKKFLAELRARLLRHPLVILVLTIFLELVDFWHNLKSDTSESMFY